MKLSQALKEYEELQLLARHTFVQCCFETAIRQAEKAAKEKENDSLHILQSGRPA